MTNLTIIVPFLNEGVEVEKTVENIRNTSGYDIDIILINDNSTDGYNYENIASKYQTYYLKNKHRLGVAASRDLGIENCRTDFFLLLDGHMRFYEKNWHSKLYDYLFLNENSLLCCSCLPLDSTGEPIHHNIPFAAVVLFDKEKNKELLSLE